MIPDGLTRAHVFESLKQIDAVGVPAGRDGRTFELRYEERAYPPKLVISTACEIAFGRVLPSSAFTGGNETNGYLRRLGFTIVPKNAAAPSRPRPSPRDAEPSETLSTTKLEDLKQELLRRAPIYTAAELVGQRDRPPSAAGVYAWFFKTIPTGVPTDGCVQRDGRTLLYVGISPSSPASAETLRTRIRYHFRGNAEGSTFRKTVGCLLCENIETVLRRVGSGTRMTFGPKEPALTQWLAEHAAVAWVKTKNPRVVERHILQTVRLPLNIEANAHNPFRPQLQGIRDSARRRARELPILADR